MLLLMFIYGVSSDFIDIKDQYFTGSNPISINVQYAITSDLTLTCESSIFADNQIKVGILASASETTLSYAIPDAGVYPLQCYSNELRSDVAIISVVSKVPFFICNNTESIYTSSPSKIIVLGLGVSNDAAFDITCSCTDSMVFPTYSAGAGVTQFHVPFTYACDNDCTCILQCTIQLQDNALPTAQLPVHIETPKLIVQRLFDVLYPYKNGIFIVSTFPHTTESIDCVIKTAEITNHEAKVVEEDITVLINLTLSMDNKFTLSSNTTSVSGVYAVVCSSGTLSTTFFFNFMTSASSTLAGDKIDFSEKVTAPCSCDVTESFCDSRCCCDSDCSSTQKAAFERCIDGPRGGDHTVKIAPDCKDLKRVTPWEKALCIKSSNSAFIGTYFNFVNESFLSSNKWNATSIVELPDKVTGQVGSPILTHSVQFLDGFLSLPGEIRGTCSSSIPLSLFQDNDSRCRMVTPSICQVGSVFNSRSYLIPDNPLMDPCKWHTSIYSSGIDGEFALIRIFYTSSDGTLINHKTAEILTSTTCQYAVTDVIYTVTVAAGKVLAVTANITLSDLTSSASELIFTRYRTAYISNSTSTVIKSDPSLGYELYGDLASLLVVPKAGDCSNLITPKFRVSTISQCSVDLTSFAQSNCLERFTGLLEQYSKFVKNTTTISETPCSTNYVTAVNLNPVNTTTHTDNELCDKLPIWLHIQIYFENNTVSGSTITNVTYSYDYGSMEVSAQTVVYVSLEYLMSDIAEPKCLFCWDVAIHFFESQQGLLNTLIVIFAGFLYFAIPKNWMSSRLV